ncbi:orotidine 5'-phosphate decarboxylase [Candidatus Woesearchaeota archaeon]|nr:orotidine 5'-phosphate decarboxylase [Candidatus Woesearchaeota archaeon]
MEQYKKDFIDFLLNNNALRIGSDHSLKSKRLSPWFVNIGDFNTGGSIASLGGFYASALLNFRSNSEKTFDILYGIPEKGNALVVATAIKMNEKGTNLPWFFTRKIPKEYGEATNLSQADRTKALVVGRAPQNNQSIAQLDDVFTAGDAKYEAREILESLGNFNYPVLVIGVDRQEVGIDGKSAIEEYEKNTGTKVVSIVTASEVYSFLKELSLEKLEKVRQEIHETNFIISDLGTRVDPTPVSDKNLIKGLINELAAAKENLKRLNDLAITYDPGSLSRLATYLRVYGTRVAKESLNLNSLEQIIIERDRSVIPACDTSSLEKFEEVVKQTADIDKIGGYKIGFELGLSHGLPKLVETVKKHTNKTIIYDHQKAGTDIPDTGKNFAKVCKSAGVDAVIFFPQSGPETERAWIYHALDNGLEVIIGGRMTHPAYSVSEGGFITDEGALEMYRIAARSGINNFVVPGNKPDVIALIKKTVEGEGINPVFYAPGFVAQGGKIEDATKVAGNKWHAIVGRGILQAEDVRKAAIEHTSQI